MAGSVSLSGGRVVAPAMLDAWAAAVTATLMGSERAALPPSPIDGLPVPAAGDREGNALASLAALTVCVMAGASPPPEGSIPFEPAPERLPDCAAVSANRLSAIIAPRGPLDLLDEWCALALAAGVSIPAEHTHAVYSKGKAYRTGNVMAALGPTLGWLRDALGKPSPAEAAAASDDWTAGDDAQRRASFAAWRARDPDAAREALVAGWATERLTLRLAILEEMQPLPADEPLLEALLDDPAKKVREKAAAILSSVPDSRYGGRMRARALAAVALAAKRLPLARVKHAVSVDLPDDDPALARDGLATSDFPPRPGDEIVGRRTQLLEAVIERAPMATWAGSLPQAWIAGALAGEWASSLVPSWARRALRERDRNWSLAIFDALADHRLGEQAPHWVKLAYGLSAWPLSGAEREAHATALMRKAPDDAVVGAINICQAPWSERFTGDVFGWLGGRLIALAGAGVRPNLVVNEPGLRGDSAAWAAAGEVAARLTAFEPGSGGLPFTFGNVVQAAELLRFRREMRLEFER